jgi:hypothetical protein
VLPGPHDSCDAHLPPSAVHEPDESTFGGGCEAYLSANPAGSEESSAWLEQLRALSRPLAGGAEPDGLRQAPEFVDHLRRQLPADVCHHVSEVSPSR